MPQDVYPLPAGALLERGETDVAANGNWPDYVGDHGLTAHHVPDLIRMLRDPALLDAPADSPKVYASIHAWRALGQLHAEAAIGPLLELLRDEIEDDCVGLSPLEIVSGSGNGDAV